MINKQPIIQKYNEFNLLLSELSEAFPSIDTDLQSVRRFVQDDLVTEIQHVNITQSDAQFLYHTVNESIRNLQTLRNNCQPADAERLLEYVHVLVSGLNVDVRGVAV